MLWASAAGLLGIVALAGFWIVLHALVRTPSNPLANVSQYPLLTVVIAFAMAGISGGVSEEAGFRGYFQGTLEKHGLGWGSVVIAALVMAPVHAETQGFVWPNMLFYLLVDVMLGALAYLTKSIRPGVVVHSIGLFVFFTLIWPTDAARPMFAAGGDHTWFWIHVGQTVVFAALSLAALIRLARVSSGPKVNACPGQWLYRWLSSGHARLLSRRSEEQPPKAARPGARRRGSDDHAPREDDRAARG